MLAQVESQTDFCFQILFGIYTNVHFLEGPFIIFHYIFMVVMIKVFCNDASNERVNRACNAYLKEISKVAKDVDTIFS